VQSKKEQLVAIAGAANVFDDASTLQELSRDHSFAVPRKPWYVVRPGNAEEVQKLAQWANQTQTALVPVSSGAPHFHGDTVPSVAESVIVDLSRMNQILRLDKRNKVVHIEPGVTYSQLSPVLAEQGLRICRPLLPRANKSVIASLLERQPTMIPRFNYSLPEPLRDCGVVWGTGELAFTGEAALGPMSLEKQWEAGFVQIDPKGPMASDLMRVLTGAQGSMGIVIWASVKCELTPAAQKYRFVPGNKLEDLIDFSYKLLRLRVGDEVMILNRARMATLFARPGGDVPSCAEDLPAWAVVIGLAGAGYYPQERVEVQEKEINRLAQEFQVPVWKGLPGISHAEVMATISGCSDEPHWKLKARGACADIFFLTTLDKAPQYVETVRAVAEAAQYPGQDISVYIQPQHHGVSQHVEFSLAYDPGDPKAVARVKEVYAKASAELVAQGAYFSRPYGAWADLVYSRDATAVRVLRVVKQIVDPNNVLNPGKLCF
jgi:hypothetical protein